MPLFSRCRRRARPHRPRFDSSGSRGRRLRSALLALALACGLLVWTPPLSAQALPRGESLVFPGGLILSNFIMPNGTRAYCIEIQFGEPTGHLFPGNRSGMLPGRAGQLHSWDDPRGMRQLNYLIETRGQTRDAWQAAAVQLTVWRMRENFLAANPYLNSRIAILEGSARGRALIATSDALVSEARANARPPVPAPSVSGALRLSAVPEGTAAAPGAASGAASPGTGRRVRVSYPAGTTELSVTGGTFVRGGGSRLGVTGGETSQLIDVARGTKQLSVSGRWETRGARGWEPLLVVHDTRTALGESAQRIAVATGASDVPKRAGRLAAVSIDAPVPLAPPQAASLAQPAAELGGTLADELLLTEAPGTRAQLWPGATAEFVAYLLPEPGAPKYDERWEPRVAPLGARPGAESGSGDGAASPTEASSPAAGASIPDGAPLGEAAEPPAEGTRAADAAAASGPEGGAAAEPGAAPGVNEAEQAEADSVRDPGAVPPGAPEPGAPEPGAPEPSAPEPRATAQGSGVPSTAGSPDTDAEADSPPRGPGVEEDGPSPLVWSAEEIAAMTPAERCTAQPVSRQAGIPIRGLGSTRSAPIEARSEGTIHWVERVVVGGRAVHTGKCGIANERTRIGRPGVATRALPSVPVGGTVTDTAIVSGEFAPGARYRVRFDAFRALTDAAGTPLCRADQRIYRSEALPVTGPGEVSAPGFAVRWAHGTQIWWVESLFLERPDGLQLVHTGRCGVANETSIVERPTLRTTAPEQAALGEPIRDVAHVTGAVAAGETSWELTFAGYAGEDPAHGDDADGDADGDPDGGGEAGTGAAVAPPSCIPERQLFATEPVPVDGAGEYASPAVRVSPEWSGRIWWIATLWLREGTERTAVLHGACGDLSESTRIVPPVLSTRASDIAAVGDLIEDRAELAGALAGDAGLVHELVFEGYRGDAQATGSGDARCDPTNLLFATEAIPVAELGEVRSPQLTARPEYGDTVWWVAVLRQRAADAPPGSGAVLARGVCGQREETTTLLTPRVRTEAMGEVQIGEDVYDTAIVTGRLAQRPDAEFRLRFDAYAAGDDGVLRCEPERRIAEYSDPIGVRVDGPGSYESRRVPARAEHLGAGGFVETLVLIADGVESVVHRGECGAPGERFAVQPPGTPKPQDVPPVPTARRPDVPSAVPGTRDELSDTGGDHGPLLSLAGALLLASLGAALAAGRAGRRRTRPARGTNRSSKH